MGKPAEDGAGCYSLRSQSMKESRPFGYRSRSHYEGGLPPRLLRGFTPRAAKVLLKSFLVPALCALES